MFVCVYLLLVNNERAKLAMELNEQKKAITDLQQQLEMTKQVPIQEVVTMVEESVLNSAPPTNDQGRRVHCLSFDCVCHVTVYHVTVCHVTASRI